MSNFTVPVGETIVGFWRPNQPNGQLSQWWTEKFVVDGITFNCAEQYMMHQKALLFGDNETANKILLALTPTTHRNLGRIVKGFDSAVWDLHKRAIVKRGSLAKYSQSEPLKAFLLSTHPHVLVECSAYDRIWGVGSANIRDSSTWHGQNLLGSILMEVRAELLEEKNNIIKQ
jgi:hypothetical protein